MYLIGEGKMRILLIPLDRFDVRSNEHIPGRIRLLSGTNEIIGVKRAAPFTGGIGAPTAYMRYLVYAAKVFAYGLRHRRDFDLIFCFESFYALVGVALSLVSGKPCIRDCAGVTREWLQRTKPSRFFAFAALTSEKIVSRFAKMMTVLSEADKQAYVEQGFAPDKIAVVPLVIDFTLGDEVAADKEVLRRRLGLEASKRILIFTGRRDYPPNKKAAWWINDKLAPAVSQRYDDVQILMTASGEIPQPTHSTITFTGLVPNVFEYIHASDIALAPIEQPSGTLTKVLDSMSCGKPTVVLASAANGIPQLADGHNAMVVKDGSEFIEKALYLLEHLDEAQEIGVRARRTMEQHYNYEVWETKLNEVLQRCIA